MFQLSRHIRSSLIALLVSLPVAAQDVGSGISHNDSVAPKLNLVQKVIRYFDQTNKPRPRRKFDFSFIGGPFYSSDTKFGIGLVGSALYSHSLADTVTQPSQIALKLQLSTTLFYSLALEGTHIFPKDRFRINYNVEFYSFPTYFWGIGYDAARHQAKTKFVERGVDIKADFLMNLGRHIYIGPAAGMSWTDATRRREPLEPWDGQPRTVTSTFVGLTATLDTRDVITAPWSGWYVMLSQKFHPRFLGNTTHSFSSTAFEVSHYRKVWKGGVLAGKFRSLFTYGSTPWPEMATFGGSSTMRGYYEGQYRDKCAADITVELRQHVWRRSGVAVWVGAGTVFPSLSALRWNRVLPCAGVGYRFEFKKRVNVRVDFGVGKGTTGFEFSINEAF